jgi:hypothetical protein
MLNFFKNIYRKSSDFIMDVWVSVKYAFNRNVGSFIFAIAAFLFCVLLFGFLNTLVFTIFLLLYLIVVFIIVGIIEFFDDARTMNVSIKRAKESSNSNSARMKEVYGAIV